MQDKQLYHDPKVYENKKGNKRLEVQEEKGE